METAIWLAIGVGALLLLTWVAYRIRVWLGIGRPRPGTQGQAMDEAEILTRGKGPFV